MSMQNLFRRLQTVWHPNRYHGWGKQSDFFEGWYFKLVDPGEQYAFAVIPGIALGAAGEQQAFIQRLDGKACTAAFHHFPAEDFQAESDQFAVSLGNNFFSADRIRLDLPELKGELHFESLYAWPKMLGAPGIMGWYSFVPFMECYHGVVSMDHRIAGSLEVYGKQVDFTDGRGYVEKDWGRSFPKAWIWMQSNHFDTGQRVSLMASVARIPWIGNHFTGYIAGFLLGDRLYRFATYTGAGMKIALDAHQVRLTFSDRRHRLVITAYQGNTGELISPISGNMAGKVNESMQATIDVALFAGETLLFQGTGRNAGLEVAGPVDVLVG